MTLTPSTAPDMDAAAHTALPLPLSISPIHENGGYTNDGSIVIVPPRNDDEYAGPIAHVLLQRRDVKRGQAWKAADPVRDAYAALIVRAVNSREPLLRALHDVCIQLRKRETSIADCRALDAADSAIRLAEGK